jgi:hypothetical protein
MTTPPTPDPVLAWLEEGPSELPDETRRAIAVDVHSTNQRRRGFIASWRATNVNGMSRLVLGAIAVVVAVGAGLYLFGRGGPTGQVGGPPTRAPAAPTESASPTGSIQPSAVIPDMTVTFDSEFSGFSLRHPVGANIVRAASVWSVSVEGTEGFDFIGPGEPDFGMFRAASTVAPKNSVIDPWIDAFVTGAAVGTCNPPRSTLPATVVIGRRVHVFTLFFDSADRRAVFDAFIATVDLRPEDALEAPSASPS